MQMPPDSEPTTQATTAVATPAESKEGSRAASVRAGQEGVSGGIDLEKGRGGRGVSGTIYASAELLPGEYQVPVLDPGIKSALTKPVARATEARVWYNPYRQVCSAYFITMMHINPRCMLAVHVLLGDQLGRYYSRLDRPLPIRETSWCGVHTRKHCRLLRGAERVLPARRVLGAGQGLPKGSFTTIHIAQISANAN